MIVNKYGVFEDDQFCEYKKKLHNKLFWLLVYKDPKEENKFQDVCFEKYFNKLMREINGLNELLNYPREIVEMMSLLEAAFLETQKDEFDFLIYRRLILASHNLVDKILEV